MRTSTNYELYSEKEKRYNSFDVTLERPSNPVGRDQKFLMFENYDDSHLQNNSQCFSDEEDDFPFGRGFNTSASCCQRVPSCDHITSLQIS